MVQAIGTAAAQSLHQTQQTQQPRQSNAPATVASLQAQLAQYQHQLSDCVNCASAQTLDGQVQIQEISGKISALKQTIVQVSQASPATPDYPAEAATTGAPGNGNQSGSDALQAGVAANLTVGVNIDTYS